MRFKAASPQTNRCEFASTWHTISCNPMAYATSRLASYSTVIVPGRVGSRLNAGTSLTAAQIRRHYRVNDGEYRPDANTKEGSYMLEQFVRHASDKKSFVQARSRRIFSRQT